MGRLEVFLESDFSFWRKVYKSGDQHWVDKEPSKLTKQVCRSYGPFKNILEIGCAAGIDTFYFAEHCEHIIGIDIVPDVIEIAKKNLKERPELKSVVDFEVGDAEKLRFDDKSFDFIYSLSVLHSTDITKSLKEIKRVYTGHGNVILYVFTNGDESHMGVKDDRDKADYFLNTCKEYFDVVRTKTGSMKSDTGGDQHDYLIVFMV